MTSVVSFSPLTSASQAASFLAGVATSVVWELNYRSVIERVRILLRCGVKVWLELGLLLPLP